MTEQDLNEQQKALDEQQKELNSVQNDINDARMMVAYYSGEAEDMPLKTYCFACTGYKENTTRCPLTGEDVCFDCQVAYCAGNADNTSVQCNYCGKSI